MTSARVPLAERRLSYPDAGATRPGDADWQAIPANYRAYARTVRLGGGEDVWQQACAALLRWEVKTRSGFRVDPPPVDRARDGDRVCLVARLGPITVREPAVVVAVVDEADRRVFASGTLEGHPVSGEEAFVLQRSAEGNVSLTLRSLTRAPDSMWRLAFPAVLAAQRCYRRRYARALRPGGTR